MAASSSSFIPTSPAHVDNQEEGHSSGEPLQCLSLSPEKRTAKWPLYYTLTTGVPLAPCHDEFRGPRSDYVRQDWWCRAGRENAVKTRRVEQAVVSRPLPKNYSSRSYESSLDGAASDCSNK
ncbi:hypothetical protein TNCV_2728941 [Trichonephila clavipes]|nr:hypothetical protein TNCV_2728941 [Trichonephila clavipes]